MSYNIILSSERLIYRPYKAEDIYELVELCNECAYRHCFRDLPILTFQSAGELIERNIEIWSREIDIMNDQFIFAIEEKKSGELVGSISVSKYRNEKLLNNFEIIFDIGAAFQNKGYATEAIDEIMKWAFKKIIIAGGDTKIIARAPHRNIASGRVLKKAGFKFVRETLRYNIYEMKMPFYDIIKKRRLNQKNYHRKRERFIYGKNSHLRSDKRRDNSSDQ